MKIEKFRSLGLDLALEVPASEAEFNQNAKKEGACLAEATANVVYRGMLPEVRDVFLHGIEADPEKGIKAFAGIEQITKIERKTKEVRKDKDGNPVLAFAETEGEYFDRVCSTMKVEASHFQPVMDQVCKLVHFDASQRERKPAAPRKLADKYKSTAEAILAGKNVKKFQADVKAALNKDIVVTGDKAKDVEAFGWAVKDLFTWREEQELKKMRGE